MEEILTVTNRRRWFVCNQQLYAYDHMHRYAYNNLECFLFFVFDLKCSMLLIQIAVSGTTFL